MTLYKRDLEVGVKMPLKYPQYPEAYELRLIDDYEEIYTPFYDVAALDETECIGEFRSLAIVLKANFVP